MYPDFIEAQKNIYEPCGLVINNLVQEPESQDYGACTFSLNNQRIAFRVAKITPTKVGQFVTFWKRINDGPIMPYDLSDAFDFLVVSVRSGQHRGQFVFPKIVLYEKGMVSKNGHGGKRAIRVYPSWDKADNPQAKRTQAWQSTYFFETNADGSIDRDKVKSLLV